MNDFVFGLGAGLILGMAFAGVVEWFRREQAHAARIHGELFGLERRLDKLEGEGAEAEQPS